MFPNVKQGTGHITFAKNDASVWIQEGGRNHTLSWKKVSLT